LQHHDADHGNVRIGDILIIYFASNSIKFTQQIKKVYRVSSVSENNFKPTVYDTALLVSLYFITYLVFLKNVWMVVIRWEEQFLHFE
jgi:hypothetical protein